MLVTRRGFLWFFMLNATAVAAAGTSASLVGPLAGVTKLDIPAAIQAEGVPVSALLTTLSARTGVNLASRGVVADDKVVIFGPRRPVRETLADLAALLNATWREERSTTGASRYVLEAGAAAQRYEQKLARARIDALASRVDTHVRALAETPEQLARRPANDLTRGLLSDPQYRLAAEFFSLLRPAQREQLFARRRLNVPFDALNGAQQDGLRRIWSSVLEAEAAYAATPEGMTARLQRRKPEDVERGFLRMRVQRIGGSALIGMFAGGFPVASEAVTGEEGRQGFSTSGWPIYFVKGKDTWLLPAHGNPYTGEPVNQDPQLPAAAAQLAPQSTWIATLRALAAKSGRPVLADYYRMPPVAAAPEAAATPVPRSGVALLDRVCRPAGYLWWTRDTSLLLRKRDWFDQRAYEVPDRWLTEVARDLGPQHRLSTGVVRHVLRLSPEQLAGLYSLRELTSTEEPEALYPAQALLRLIEAGDQTGQRAFPSAPALPPGATPELSPTLTAGWLSPVQQRLVPGFLAETDGMLGVQLPPAFRAWLSTTQPIRPVGPDKLPMLDLDLRWSFEPGASAQTIRLPLPASALMPASTLRVEM